MHSYSFQDTELKLCRYEDDPGQVVERLKLWGCSCGGRGGRGRAGGGGRAEGWAGGAVGGRWALGLHKLYKILTL